MTKAEATEKIVKECSNYNRCGDCPLYVKGNFTNCAIAVMIGVVPARWEDKQAHTVKIKSCPFCGGEGTVIIRKGKNGWQDRYAVLCDYEYGGCGSESGWYHYEEEAIRAWNRRTDDGRD